MRNRINTFTYSRIYASSAQSSRPRRLMKMRANANPRNPFQTRIYTDLHGFSGFIVLIRAICGCKSQEKASTILTELCKTKPICRRDKIQVSPVLTKDYEENARPAGESKQSQTKPISDGPCTTRLPSSWCRWRAVWVDFT